MPRCTETGNGQAALGQLAELGDTVLAGKPVAPCEVQAESVDQPDAVGAI